MHNEFVNFISLIKQMGKYQSSYGVYSLINLGEMKKKWHYALRLYTEQIQMAFDLKRTIQQ